MSRRITARARLTLLYTSLFAISGGVVVTITYALLAHSLQGKASTITGESGASLVQKCVEAQTSKSGGSTDAKAKCANLFVKGVTAGASAQRDTALRHLLLYSLITLAAVVVLAAVAGWLVAGRILRPVHQITVAARAASQGHLGHRLALPGPRDELRELADTFDEMLDRLDRAFTAQQQFIANASHELRTPLTLMRTTIDVVLAKERPTPDELVAMSTDVRAAVDHAERLIDVLLTLARNEQPRDTADPLDLAVVAEDALDGRDPAGLTTITTLGAAPVNGDGTLLERLVGNLLDNAARYNVPGGSIAISTATDDGAAILRIVNTGPVIAPDQVERLFVPFTRAENRTRHDGFGLGLALVKSITAAHHGTVSAAAVPTGGLDVIVRLPRRGDAPQGALDIAATRD